MKTQTALALIDQVDFMPNWTIEAQSYEHRFEDAICITVCCDTWRSEREMAKQGYPETTRPRASFCIMVGDMKEPIELYRAMILEIVCYVTHEVREFFRVKPTFWAPFHPHKPEGMMAWGTPELDKTYGMV